MSSFSAQIVGTAASKRDAASADATSSTVASATSAAAAAPSAAAESVTTRSKRKQAEPRDDYAWLAGEDVEEEVTRAVQEKRAKFEKSVVDDFFQT